MTVNELIDELQKVEDKEQDVIDGEWNLIIRVLQDDYGIMLC